MNKYGFQEINLSDSMVQSIEEEYNQRQRQKEIKSKEIMNSIKVSLQSLGTNFLYNLDEFYSVSLSELVKPNPHKVSFFGRVFDCNEKNTYKAVEEYLNGTTWFSYRKKFPYLLSSTNRLYSTDASKLIRLGLYSTGGPDVHVSIALQLHNRDL